VLVGFQDGAIHTRSKSEIVCVDDEAAHRASLAGRPGSNLESMFRPASPVDSYLFAALTLAQRAFWARRIAARPLALMRRRVLFAAVERLLPPLLYTPANAASAAFNPDSCCWSRSRSLLNCPTILDKSAIVFKSPLLEL
jgi:hypothetical protein